MEMTRSTRMMAGTDEAESNRIINEALNVALMTSRLLVAWHSGEAWTRRLRCKASGTVSARSDQPRDWVSMRRHARGSHDAGMLPARHTSGHLSPGGSGTSCSSVTSYCNVVDDIIGPAYLRGRQQDEGRIQDQTQSACDDETKVSAGTRSKGVGQRSDVDRSIRKQKPEYHRWNPSSTSGDVEAMEEPVPTSSLTTVEHLKVSGGIVATVYQEMS